ncbi:28 kDa ribonucleoprotein, chloroplastic-like [Curcuma longa]|uniref:28 kDa ribonucleoprotein, chloroplastic-like n=1 Tax=Curcuma longa TaxID=136217 RepID=UPI003D9DF632
MAASMPFKLSVADALLPSFPPVLFSSEPWLPQLLPLLRSSKPLRLSSSLCSSSISLNKKPPFLPLVARTSYGDFQKGLDLGITPVLEELAGEEEEQTEKPGTIAQGLDGFVEKPKGEDPSAAPPDKIKLYVGNLPYNVGSQKLSLLFEKAGAVEVAEVIYNRLTGQSRGFGFVTMSTAQEAEKALKMFNNYEFDGRLLTVNKAAPKGPHGNSERSFRIFIGSLPSTMDDDHLEILFNEHGKVLEAKVIYDNDTGFSRCYGFVKMASKSQRDDAIAALNGQSLDGHTLKVKVAEPQRRQFVL